MEKNEKKEMNFEILRIISMIFIILSHYTVHNNVANYTLNIGLNRFLLEITTLGNIGVIIFLLISGYFNVNKQFKFKKLIRLWFEVIFYSISIYFIFVMLGLEKFNLLTFIKNVMHIGFEKYWFITAYFSLYLLSPIINKFVKILPKKNLILYLLYGFLVISVLHTFTTNDYYFNSLFEFIYYYSIGAFFKLYKHNNYDFMKTIKKCLPFTTILLIISVIIFDLLGTKIRFIGMKSIYFFSSTSPFIIILSVSLFLIFGDMNIKYNKIINIISSSTLGIYLIHDNENIRNVLWTNILHVSNYVNSWFLPVHMILSVTIIFLICFIIDYIRKNTFGKLIDKLIGKMNFSKYEEFLLKLSSKISK